MLLLLNSKLRDETNICLFPYLICSYQKENFQISFIIKMKLSNKYCCISCDKISNLILNINLHFSLFLPFVLYFISFGSAPTHDRVGVPREPSAAPHALIQNGEWWKCWIVSSASVDQLATEYIILYNSDCGPVWMNFSCHIYSGLAIS